MAPGVVGVGPGGCLGTVAGVFRRPTRLPARAPFAAAVLAVLALGAGACASVDGKVTKVSGGSEAVTSAAPTSAAPTSSAPPTTVVVTTTTPAAVFPTPAAAGEALFAAWTAGDRAAAGVANLAPPAELDKLFAAVPSPAARNRGCDEGAFDAAGCFFGDGPGGVNVHLVSAAGGWTIESVDPFG